MVKDAFDGEKIGKMIHIPGQEAIAFQDGRAHVSPNHIPRAGTGPVAEGPANQSVSSCGSLSPPVGETCLVNSLEGRHFEPGFGGMVTSVGP